MKKLKFTHSIAMQILSEIKQSTWRFFDEKNIQVGDEIEIIDKNEVNNKSDDVIVGLALVTQVKEYSILDLNEGLLSQMELITDKQDLIQKASSFYNQPIDSNSKIKVINFVLYQKNYINSVIDADQPVKIFTDGGSRGNPGPSASGYVILDPDDQLIESGSKYIGVTTNNQAEYQALRLALTRAVARGYQRIDVYMDSLLVVNQMNGIFKIKNKELWPVYIEIVDLSKKASVTFNHVYREKNKLADAEVNKILDAVMRKSSLNE